MIFLIFQKRVSKKNAPGILKLVSMHFLIFENWNDQKNCARNLKISQYAFFNI